ncbi:FixH family protein [Erythrobacter crassostreae]
MRETPRKPFTGRSMAAVMVGGFAIVIAVNFYMASLAVGGFHGVVVENSYVASQKYNDWLAQAEASKALGWEAKLSRDETGHVLVQTIGAPEGAIVRAEMRRPIGEHAFASLSFTALGDGLYRSGEPVDEDRWTARVSVEAGSDIWAEESEL